MTRIYDTFPMHDELDVLEMRLYELESIPNLTHVIIEAEVTHQDDPKPSYLKDNWGRFERWHDRIRPVWATGLPTVKDDADPWAREHAQREYAPLGMADADSDDIVLHGDIDEIPTVLAARNVRPQGYVAFDQRCYCFAVDWLHPDPWRGTVAARVKNVGTFSRMRDARNFAFPIMDAGWHLSWLGGTEQTLKKLGAFCHPEVADRIHRGLEGGNVFLNEGWHVDKKRLLPVDVNGSWPRWIVDKKCPTNWYRPR